MVAFLLFSKAKIQFPPRISEQKRSIREKCFFYFVLSEKNITFAKK